MWQRFVQLWFIAVLLSGVAWSRGRVRAGRDPNTDCPFNEIGRTRANRLTITPRATSGQCRVWSDCGPEGGRNAGLPGADVEWHLAAGP